MARWIAERARERDIRIAPAAAVLLAERVGANVRERDVDRRRQGELAVSELEKLALYRLDGQITPEDVEALVADAVPGSTWAFLDANADVNAKATVLGTALMMASESGHLEIVRALLAAGADVNTHVNGETALILASLTGHLEVVRALLDAKADVNAKRSDGTSSLMLASYNGNQQVVRALLDAKADVNAKDSHGVTALEAASRNGHTEVVQLLKSASGAGR